MVVFKFNPAETGLRKTIKEYEEIALRYIWSLDEEGAGSGKTWEHANKELSEGKSISRASIIFYQDFLCCLWKDLGACERGAG